MSFENLLQNDAGTFKYSGAEMSAMLQSSRLLYEQQIQTRVPPPGTLWPDTNPAPIEPSHKPAGIPGTWPAKNPAPVEPLKPNLKPTVAQPGENQPTEQPSSMTTDLEKKQAYVFNTHIADSLAIAAGVASAYIDMNNRLPARFEYGLSQQSVSQLRKSITEMRLNLIQNVVIPAEQGMSRLGWQAGDPWIMPRNRSMLLHVNSRQIFQPEGRNGNLWRDHHGKLNQTFGDAFAATNSLSHSELNTALENGALRPREASLVSNLRQAEQELVKLTALDEALKRNVHRPSEFPNAYGRVFGTPRGLDLLNQHNTLLDAARRELTAAELADRQAISHARRGFGAMVGAHVAGKIIDGEFFQRTPVSLRTGAIDLVSPSIVLSRLHWSAKGAVILGSHVASRLLDYTMNQSK